MLPIVLDASALVKLVLDEPAAVEFRAWYDAYAGEALHGPSLLYSEVGRVLQKARPRTSAAELAAVHEEVLRLVRLDAPTAAETPHVWKLASGLPFYDAEYARLAQRLGGVLVTADKKMADRARKAGVQVKEF